MSSSLFAQPSAVYTDAQEAFKKGMEFYHLDLYGKAQEELEKAASAKIVMHSKNDVMPLFVQKAELYAAISAMRLERADAEKRLMLFIQKNEPNSLATQAKLEVGRFYYAKRDYDQVIEFMSKITWSELGDMNNEEITEAKFQLAYSYFVKKKFQQAMPLFQQIKGGSGEYYLPANYYYGLCCFFQKNYKEALKSFALVEKDKKYDDVVPTYITQIHFMLKDYDEVIKYGTPFASDSKVRERLLIVQAVGQAHYEKGNYDKALPFIEEFVDKTPKVTEDLFYQLAYAQYRAKRYDAAATNFEQISGLDSKLGQLARYNQADCQLKLGQKKEARLSFEQASMKTYDKDVQLDALMNYAKLSYQLGFDNDAITAFTKLMDTKYNNESQNLLSKLFLNTRDYDKALTILRGMKLSTASLKETYQKVAYFRGVQYYKEGNYNKATELFDESLKSPVHNETTALCNYWKAEAQFQMNKYDLSIKEYDKFLMQAPSASQLPSNSSEGTAHYGIGYNYLRKNDYSNAAGHFRDAVDLIQKQLKKINDQHVLNFVYPDALVRAADCYLFLGAENKSNYDRAIGFYSKVLNNNYPNEDYALYQLSLIYSLQNKTSKQFQTINQLVSKYPNSTFADDALYAKGSTHINQNEFNEAKQTFDNLILKYPNSEFNSRAMYKLGVISYSKDRTREALDYFKAVVKSNVQTDEAKEALSYIRRIYIEGGDPDGFMAYVSTLQGYNFSDMAADSLLYESAQTPYDAGNWAQAAQNYSKYLERFPRGLNSMQAHLNRGISYYNEKSYPNAMTDFEAVVDAKNPAAPNSMAEEANLLAGRISFHVTKNYMNALKYYKNLEPLASNPENRFEARLYGMRAAFYADAMDPLRSLSENLLQEASATAQNKAEAYYYLAKAHLSKKNYSEASKNFTESIKLVGDDIRASEGRYQLAKILYLQRELEKSMDLAFQNNKQLGQHLDWLARNFILIADIYAEQGNLDAAKGTLESLLKNYNGDPEIVKEAKTKLENIKKAKSSNSRLKLNNDSGELEMINGK